MIVGLSGYATAGKDSVGKILVDSYGFRRVSFAERLKALAVDLDPILEVEPDLDTAPYKARLSYIVGIYGSLEAAKELPAVRGFLQLLGTKVRTHLGPDAWVDAALRDVEPGEDIVVTDCRFTNEAAAIKALGGQVLRVHRPGVKAINDHASEHDLDSWRFDGHVYNDGSLDKLAVQVGVLVAYLNLGRVS